MNDVTIIQASQPDRAQQWRVALERCVSHPNFGRQIVVSQFADKNSQVCISGESWEITSDFETIIQAEVAFPLPMLNIEAAWMYQEILREDEQTNSGVFARLWRDSLACQDCANELRKALEEEIKFFQACATEIRRERITEKLVA